MDRQKIIDRLKENYKTTENMGYELIGIFLQGSQNYELDYDNSDVDCKAIILPKFEDFVLNNKPISTTHVLENNEHIDLKDIRLMFDCFKKQNINFVEILFTKYMVLNPKYQQLFQPLIDNNEMIARYNNYASVNCISGMAMEKRKALEHPYPATIDKIEKYGYDSKQLHHLIRLGEFLPRYIEGELYKDCLISNMKNYLVKVKGNNAYYNLEEARKLADDKLLLITSMKNNYMNNHEVVINHDVDKLLNEVLVNCMKLNFKTELGV